MTEPPARRLLLVHAHPDDESITTGATMARCVAEGGHVTLVTCTLGEEGEVIPPDLAHLASDRDDALGPYRVGELAAAMAELGVTDHRFLGGPGRYRDSGMMGVPQNDRPHSFWRADVDEAAAHLVAVVRETGPRVLVTYDPDGGYGHPDHIQAHRVATRAVELAADPAFRPDLGAAHTVDRVFWVRVSRPVVEAGLAALAADGPGNPFGGIATLDEIPGVVEESGISVEIDGRAHLARKAAALRAHATQVTVDGAYFTLSNDRGQPLLATEYFTLVRGVPLDRPDGGRGDDLFAGLAGVPATTATTDGSEV